MSTYLSRAIAYIERNGSELERFRLLGILGNRNPQPRIVRTLLSKQNEDGGFPYDLIPGRPSSIHYTLTVLAWLRDLHVLDSPTVQKVITYLFTIQRPDGSWDENPAVVKFDPPPPMRPGLPLVRTSYTAQVGYWLTLLGYAEDYAVGRALDYLRPRHSDGRFEGFPHTTWFALALFARAEEMASKIVQQALASLASVPIEQWDATQLTSMLDCLWEAGVGKWDPPVEGGLKRLLALQSPEGGWATGIGQAIAVETTLRAIRVLTSFGVPAVLSY